MRLIEQCYSRALDKADQRTGAEVLEEHDSIGKVSVDSADGSASAFSDHRGGETLVANFIDHGSRCIEEGTTEIPMPAATRFKVETIWGASWAIFGLKPLAMQAAMTES